MNKNFFKQFAIAIILFLLGYFTFNSKLFAAEISAIPASNVNIETNPESSNNP